MDRDRKALQLRITGRVQGVNFRAWTRIEAEGLGLDGWVRNERDGSVTALIVGPPASVDTMLDRLWSGPPSARVSGVVAGPADPADAPAGFRITG